MTKEEFLQGFQEQFDDTDPSMINMDTKYKELEEWSSMMALIIIAYVDEKFSGTLVGDDFKKSETVEDLYNIVAK